jgi:hypothetical protein
MLCVKCHLNSAASDAFEVCIYKDFLLQDVFNQTFHGQDFFNHFYGSQTVKQDGFSCDDVRKMSLSQNVKSEKYSQIMNRFETVLIIIMASKRGQKSQQSTKKYTLVGDDDFPLMNRSCFPLAATLRCAL